MFKEKGGKVMLKVGKISILMFIIFIFLYSCAREKPNEKMYALLLQLSNRDESVYVKELAKDTLFSWIENKLSNRSAEYISDYSNVFLIDSIIAINKEKDKAVIAVLYSNIDLPLSTMDAISFLYGVKIRETWYFFHGPIIHLPREFYQKDIHTPLSFEKLHEIAMREIYSGYLIKHKKDAGFWNNTFAPQYEYEVNDAWFDRHFKNKGVCSYCETEEDFEEVWKYNALYIWKQ